MTILLIPYLGCNLKCRYCFQGWSNPAEYNADVNAMIETLKEIYVKDRAVHLHGGECTVIPKNDFARLLEIQFKLTGRSSIQTNGYAITEDHIKLFRKYKTSVGVSIDGPKELNRLRGFRDPDKYNDYYSRVEGNIKKMIKAGIPVSFLVVLTEANIHPEALPKMLKWLTQYRQHGVTARFNPAFKKFMPPTEMLENAFEILFGLHLKCGGGYEPFKSIINRLKGFGGTCWMHACNPLNPKTISILPDGRIGPCDRMLPETYTPNFKAENFRIKLLWETECNGCKYFKICFGGCPQEGGWRHKTPFCQAYKNLFQLIESTLSACGVKVALHGNSGEKTGN